MSIRYENYKMNIIFNALYSGFNVSSKHLDFSVLPLNLYTKNTLFKTLLK